MAGQSKAPILITGVSGFLGWHLARRLVAKTDRTVVGVFFSKTVSIPRVDTIPVDLRDRLAVGRLLRDLRPSEIYHCAAITDAAFCQREPDSARAGIVEATQNIVSGMQDQKLDAALGVLSTDLVFDGTAAPYDPQAEAKPLSIYGSLKFEAEQAAMEAPTCFVLRSALMYGPKTPHRSSFLGWMSKAILEEKPLILFEDEYRTPVYVDDLCFALESLMATKVSGLFHGGGPERLSRVEMGRILCSQLKGNAECIRPTRLSDSTYDAPRAADVSLNSERTWETTTTKDGQAHRPKGFAEALADFGASFENL